MVGDEHSASKWLNSENRRINGRPVDLIRQTEGLVRVVHYLDASRGLV
ncbi:MbcA/ParS/Xre antitoxin family protein [Quisquiliibacterium transsilvanicum]